MIKVNNKVQVTMRIIIEVHIEVDLIHIKDMKSYSYLVAFFNAGSLKLDQNLALSISFFTFGFKIPVS
jgi:hypothetical protein